MPLTRFKLSAIEDGGIATADLADGSVTTAKIADSAVTTVKTSNLFTNTEISGTEAARMPVGTTAQRANAQGGDIRFNSTLALMEYYDGTQWKAIDSPPTISSVSPATIADGTTVTVAGSNFQTGVNVSVIGSNGTVYTPASVTRVSGSSITFDATTAMISGSLDYFDVKVSNPSGLSVTSEDALEIASVHTWATAAGSLGTIYDTHRTDAQTFNAGTTYSGGESDVTVTHSITSGTLPSGLSISTAGVITGTTSAVGSDTTTNITVQYSAADASAGTTVTGTRNFSILQKAPTITTYTSTGSGTFSVPTGLAAVDVLVIAGGGVGGGANSAQGTDGGGGGGAGGFIYRPSFPVTPGGSVSYTVGAGGTQSTYGWSNQTSATTGQDSVFGTLVSKGGGAGQSGPGDAPTSGPWQGGSGGGAGGGGGSGSTGGQATQPQQPGDSATYGFGYPGGSNTNTGPYNGNGGGGAGGTGTQGSDGNGNPVPGGAGKSNSISGSSVSYAGGGGGAGGGPGPGAGGSGAAGGGTGKPSVDSSPLNGTAASANRGSGGGGGAGIDGPRPWNSGVGGAGGSGIVIVKY